MSTLPGRWTEPEKFEVYTRWSVYILFVFVPLAAAAIVSSVSQDHPRLALLYGIGSVIEAALGALVSSRAFTQAVGGRRMPLAWVIALATVGMAQTVLALQIPLSPDGRPERVWAVVLALGLILAATAPMLNTRAIAVGVLLVALAAGAAAAAGLPPERGPGEDYLHPLPAFISAAAMTAGIAFSTRVTAWMLKVVRELDRSRAVHARLAVAEERLRFSRDLHDVAGRALSAIAVKSELATELSRRGQDGAAEQMAEIRHLAQETLREVRGAVSGYRATDLAAELDGARSVLRSAGVETRVTGVETELPEPVQEALGWVVREGVTNVIRHARARTCTIDLEVDAGTARLTIGNDGVRGRPSTAGSGLLGIRERLAPLGGELTTTHEDDSFVLAAVVPVPAAAARGSATMERP